MFILLFQLRNVLKCEICSKCIKATPLTKLPNRDRGSCGYEFNSRTDIYSCPCEVTLI